MANINIKKSDCTVSTNGLKALNNLNNKNDKNDCRPNILKK